MHDPDLADPELLCRIPSVAGLILDVGCGTGALGAEHKRRNPRAKVLGIEANAEAAAIAAGRLDQVYIADLDLDPTPFAGEIDKGAIDCLIYGDALSRLRDPWQALRRHVEYLAGGGSVLLSVPNVEHWSFAARLLRGTWGYDEAGLLDAAHLRWFTADAVARMLRGAGLVPIDRTPRTVDAPDCESFVEALAPALRTLGIDADAYRQRAEPLHHVWRARRRPVADKLAVVSTMLPPIGGVSDVRVIEPMQALRADPSLAPTVIAHGQDTPSDIDGPRIFIFHRPLLAGDWGLEHLKSMIRNGWLVVCEFDDHPDYIAVLRRPNVLNFRAVHAVQTTTQPLAEVLRQHNPEVKAFANAVQRLPDVANFTRDDRCTLVFAGLNREGEWPEYIEAINAAADGAGDRLHFEIINDRAFFDALRTPHKHFTPLCDYETYQAILSRCEISFMPLTDTPFNRCKSDLKHIEAAASRVVSLASTVVYEDSIEDGRTGVLFRTPGELRQHLSRLVADLDGARAIADAARHSVRETRMLAYQLADRAAWYHSLWARRGELHRSLLARVPELAG
jgi:SAM-dependent methyltransferase